LQSTIVLRRLDPIRRAAPEDMRPEAAPRDDGQHRIDKQRDGKRQINPISPFEPALQQQQLWPETEERWHTSCAHDEDEEEDGDRRARPIEPAHLPCIGRARHLLQDRKSTRLNSSHVKISYAVFCLKKKKDSPG